MSAPIFISYSSKDQDIAETIYRALEARGHDCWIACRDVQPGENYQEAIVRALRSAKVMLLVFTSNANNSDEIKKELVLAGRHRVTVVPVRVEDVAPNDAFTYELATRQWIDLFKDWERQIGILAARLGSIMQTEPAGGDGNAAPAPPRAGRATPNPALMWGPLLAAILVVAGGAALYLHGTAPASPPVAAPAGQTASAAPPSQANLAAQTPQTPPPAAQAAPAPASSPAPAAPPLAPAQTAMQPASPAPVAAASTPTPLAAAAPAADPDEAAWQSTLGAGTREALGAYLNSFSGGAHAQEARLRLADAIRTDAAPSKAFDGAWQTTWTCENFGRFPGYVYQLPSQIRDGVYHAQHGKPGDPGSLQIDGKIEADGSAGFFGKGIVGTAVVALGMPRGTQYAFHALGHFAHAVGDAKRLEGRPCTLSFTKE